MDTEGTKRTRILVIDDDEVMRDLLPALLDLQLDDVHVVGSGQDALAVLQASPAPELLLTDLQMPGLEGRELIAALRAAAPAETLLLGMSATRPDDPTLLSLDAFLSKPFGVRELDDAIEIARKKRMSHLSTVDHENETAAVEETLAAGDHLPVLDEAIFSALALKFQPDVLGQIYTMTLDDVAQRLQSIEDHIASGDLAAVRREAHAIKGGCAWVGARELAHLAAAAEGGTTLSTVAFADFPAACMRLRRMLEAKLQP